MRPLGLTHLDENGNPSWRLIALGESLSGQSLGILGQVEDFNEHMLSKMREKISGYNSRVWKSGRFRKQVMERRIDCGSCR